MVGIGIHSSTILLEVPRIHFARMCSCLFLLTVSTVLTKRKSAVDKQSDV
ncbi:hypothetical protein DAI22_02g126000 [Oryza sativa Japonica Group]|nr:hypothetical protein DAI22_02g126000 [Oryza sativa Japonica Group]